MNAIFRLTFLLLFSSISAYAQPTVNLGNDTTICAGNTVMLDASNPTSTFLWSTGATTQTIVVGSTGVYWVDVTGVGGTTRDSITVTVANFPGSPLFFRDTAACIGETIIFQAQNSAVINQWYLLSTGAQISNLDSLIYLVNTSDSLRLQSYGGYNEKIRGLTTRGLAASSGFYNLGAYRGLRFDAKTNIHLHSVEVTVDAAFSGVVELRNSSGVLLRSKAVSMPSVGTFELILDFAIAIGNNYQLRLANGSGGKVYLENPYSSWANLDYPDLKITGSAPFNNAYNCLYKWKVWSLVCQSTDTAHIGGFFTPIVNLGVDTSTCGSSIVLDATNAGAVNYLWSNGATTATISVSNTDTISVAVSTNTNPVCSGQDTVAVYIFSTPTTTIFPGDTSACRGASLSFIAQDPGAYTEWRQLSNGQRLGNTNTISYVVNASDSIELQSYGGYVQKTRGLITLNSTGSGGYYSLGAYRALRFDAKTDIHLHSVEITVDAAFGAVFELQNSGGQVLASKSINLATAGTHELILDFAIPTGNNYQLRLTNGSGGKVYLENPYSAWVNLDYSDMRITGSLPFANAYNCFYKWRLWELQCPKRDTIHVGEIQTPTLNLGSDTSICGGSIVLDATNTGSVNYLWSTGATTSSITVTNTSTISVLVSTNSNPACTDSDTISLGIYNRPVASILPGDTSICIGQSLNYTAQGGGAYSFWYQLSDGKRLGVTNSIAYTALQPDSISLVAYGGYSEENFGLTNPGTGGGSGFANVGSYRSLKFDAKEDIYLRSVEITVNAALTAQIQLRSSAGTIINTKNLSLPAAGTFEVILDFSIAQANNYEMRITNAVGGSVFIEPFSNWSALNTPSLYITNSLPFANVYNVFYKWKLYEFYCEDTSVAVTIDTLTTPYLGLPADTLYCGPTLTLDVTNPSASYLWSTGSTSPTITFSMDTTVNVIVSIGPCTVRDTIAINVLDTAMYSISDTTLCGGLINLSLQSNPNIVYYWWNTQNGGTLYNVGDIYSDVVVDTTVFYIEGRSVKDIVNVGRPFSLGNPFPVLNTRGTIFDVTEEVIIDSLTIHASNNLSTVLEIRDNANTLLYSYPLQLSSGANKIKLDAFLMPANGYKIVLTNPVGGGQLNIDLPVTYPMNYGPIVFTSGFPNTTHYHYFFDWKVKTMACPTTRKPMNVNILPTPLLFWPEDSVVCTNLFTLDATYQGATYLWSTGATTSFIDVTQSDTVSLNVSIGTCFVVDTLEVILSTPPSMIAVQNDTTVCPGVLTLNSSSDGFTQVWYTDSSSSAPLAFGDSLSVNVTDTSTFWVEGVQFLPKSDYYGVVTHPVASGAYDSIRSTFYPARGIVFDVFETILINQVSIYVTAATSATINLKDKYGLTVYSQNVQLNIIGENVVTLNWLLTANTDYLISMENVVGGEVYAVNSFSFPLSYNEIRLNYGYPEALRTKYSCFFKWRISSLGCATTRIPVTVNVPESPAITMPADTTICNGSAVSLEATQTNTAYQYLWSSGETTNNVTFISEGLYTVTVSSNGICSRAKTVLVQFPTTPTAINTADISICSPQAVSLLTNPNDGILLWYNLPGAAAPIYISTPYNTYITDTSTYRLEVAARVTTRIGETDNPNPSNSALYQSFILANTFDVYMPTVLDSIAVYINDGSATFDIILQNNTGTELQRKTVSVNQAFTKVFLPLDFVIMPGNDYRLMFANIGNTKFLVDNTTTYPQMTSAAVASLTGTIFPGVAYNCFFDWNFSYALTGCYAAQSDTFTVAVQLPIDLVDSIFTCDSATLDVQTAAATNYAWSTGANASAITVAGGIYTVTVSSNGGCVLVDTVVVTNPPTVGLPTNGITCGNTLTTSYTNQSAVSFLWSTGETTSTIAIPVAAFYAVTVVTNEGCVLTDTSTISTLENPPIVNLGTSLNVCFTDTLDAGYAGQGMSYIWNTGATTQTLIVSTQGNYEVTVTSPNGCSGSDDIIIIPDSLPTASFTYIASGGTTFSFTNTSQNWDGVIWDFGDATSTTFVAPFHLYQNTGCYEVRLIANNQCGSDTSYTTLAVGIPITDCDTASAVQPIALETLDELVLAPNPNTGSFDLYFTAEENKDDVAIVQVFAVDGRLVYTKTALLSAGQKQLRIDMVDIPAGSYWLRLQRKKGIEVAKLVILRG